MNEIKLRYYINFHENYPSGLIPEEDKLRSLKLLPSLIMTILTNEMTDKSLNLYKNLDAESCKKKMMNDIITLAPY